MTGKEARAWKSSAGSMWDAGRSITEIARVTGQDTETIGAYLAKIRPNGQRFPRHVFGGRDREYLSISNAKPTLPKLRFMGEA